MSIKKITAVITAAVTMTTLTACKDKKVEKDKPETPTVTTVEETSAPTETVETIPVETFPDYPISYPKIEKKRMDNVYEAEDSLMTEGLEFSDAIPEKKNKKEENDTEKPTSVIVAPYSGDGYVTGFKKDGSSYVIFEVDAPSNQHYDLSFSIASEKLVNCRVSVNDKETATFVTKEDNEFTLITLYGVFLTKGKTKITLCPVDGDLKLDYLKLSNNTSLSTIQYNAANSLSNEAAGESAKLPSGAVTLTATWWILWAPQ